MHAGRAQIKGVLRDQRRIAGIGNAYSDEILHAARMSPFHPASMPAEEVHRLYEALRQVLGDAVELARGVAASSLKAEKRQGMRVHGRKGEACPVCGDTVRQAIYRLHARVLRHLPDRRQAARRPGALATGRAALNGRRRAARPVRGRQLACGMAPVAIVHGCTVVTCTPGAE